MLIQLPYELDYELLEYLKTYELKRHTYESPPLSRGGGRPAPLWCGLSTWSSGPPEAGINTYTRTYEMVWIQTMNIYMKSIWIVIWNDYEMIVKKYINRHMN
jgi:hypothetical protein